MLLIHCPYCAEDLPELEFAYAGEAHIARPADPSTLTDEEWRDFLFIRTNPRGHHFERWRHINGCGRSFNAVRETVSDRFLTTFAAGLPRPERITRAEAAERMGAMALSFWSESRRLDNRRLKRELRLGLRYPTPSVGL